MSINRREFIILSVALAAGCKSEVGGENQPVSLAPVSIDVGPATDYAADGVYEHFKSQGIFIVRRGPQIFALSAYCTHRRCKLNTETDHTFYCKCHGSVFDPDGKVTKGPATRDLPLSPTSIDDRGHLLIHSVAM